MNIERTTGDSPMKKHSICRLLLIALAVLSLAVPVQARMATAIWNETPAPDLPPEEQPLASRTQAREAAFADAVFAEALDVLRGNLNESRRLLLKEYLVSKSDDLVVSYSELGTESMPEGGMRLTVDVAVNKRALKHELKRIGVWYTVQEPLAYNPAYGTVAPDTWEKLGRMHLLFGLVPNSSAGISLSMDMVDDIWTMTLAASGSGSANGQDISQMNGQARKAQQGRHVVSAPPPAPITVQGGTFEDAWLGVWAKYFDAGTLEDLTADTVTLTVDGWFTSDGVEAFDRMLLEWDDVLDDANLMNVSMKPEGISASWRLRVSAAGELERKLSDYLPARGLSFTLSAE